MLAEFQAHLAASGLIAPGQTVLVGFSGGADSTCLLHLLHRAGVDVLAAHLHHGQRAEADVEEAACAAFADSLGVPFVSGRADVPRIARDLGIGLEEAGREARYEFLERARRQVGAHRLATAHTLDDHVETVLLHIARGTGLGGLAGIPAERGPIVRPLLWARRAQTRAYCQEHGLGFHDDPANVDLSFSRARVRHRVVPELEAVNPGFVAAVQRLAGMADEEDRFLNGMAAAALERTETPLNGHLRFLTLDSEVAFDLRALRAEPAVLVARGVRLAAAMLGAELDHRGTAHLVDAVREGGLGSLTAPGGVVVFEWDQGRLHVARKVATVPFRYALAVPGETESLEFGWQFRAEGAPPNLPDPPDPMVAVIDASQVQGNLFFRPAEPGDRIDPLGLGGTKKLSDVFQEARLTESARRLLPVVFDMVGPVWVPGLVVSDRVRLREETVRALRLTFGPLEAPVDLTPGTGLPGGA